MDFSRRTLILYLTYLLFLFMMTSSITAGHTVTQNAWSRPSSAYTGVAACALIFGLLVGVAGLVMTIQATRDILPEDLESPEAKASVLPILGPIFLAIGVFFLLTGISMCMYARYPMRRRPDNREQAGVEDCKDESRCPQDWQFPFNGLSDPASKNLNHTSSKRILTWSPPHNRRIHIFNYRRRFFPGLGPWFRVSCQLSRRQCQWTESSRERQRRCYFVRMVILQMKKSSVDPKRQLFNANERLTEFIELHPLFQIHRNPYINGRWASVNSPGPCSFLLTLLQIFYPCPW